MYAKMRLACCTWHDTSNRTNTLALTGPPCVLQTCLHDGPIFADSRCHWVNSMAKPCRNTGLSRARPPVNAEGATDYLFRGFFCGSARVGLGGGACKAGRAWGNMADAPPPPIPHAQGFSIRRTLIDLARFLLGSDSYAGGRVL